VLIQFSILSGVVAFGALLVFLVTAKAVARRLERIRRALVQQVGRRESPAAELLYQKHNLWAQSRQMEFLAAFRYEILMPKLIVVWKCPQPDSFFCVYEERGKQCFEFISGLDDERASILRTTSCLDPFALPPTVGVYAQSFSSTSPEDLRQRHTEALGYLAKAKRERSDQDRRQFSELVEDAVQRQIRSIRAKYFTTFRYLWWSAIASSRWGNKTVAQQHREGLWQ
jgi:hypothetical protein